MHYHSSLALTDDNLFLFQWQAVRHHEPDEPLGRRVQREGQRRALHDHEQRQQEKPAGTAATGQEQLTR